MIRSLFQFIRWFWGLARWGRLLALALILWLWVVLVLVIVIDGYGRVDRAQPADVIIVLGAGLRRDNTPGPALYRRTDQAAKLWREGYAPHLLCTGGRPMNRLRSEADACAELLRAAGVPAEAISLEENSRSTEENAIHSRAILQANGWQTAIIVSDGYHLFRAYRLFRNEGLLVVTSPAVDPPLNIWLPSLSREVLAFHWQLLKEAFNLPVTYVQSL